MVLEWIYVESLMFFVGYPMIFVELLFNFVESTLIFVETIGLEFLNKISLSQFLKYT